VLRLHRIVAGEAMDQGDAGRYRAMGVQVGEYVPPPPGEVPGLMRELIDWWNDDTPTLSPVFSSASLHYRFEAIHPFADGNGRTGRAAALWELYRRPHLLGGRVLLGGPAALLRGGRSGAAAGRGPDLVAGILRIRPLVKAKLIKRVGTLKNGRYVRR